MACESFTHNFLNRESTIHIWNAQDLNIIKLNSSGRLNFYLAHFELKFLKPSQKPAFQMCFQPFAYTAATR
jgi:hypothetical protein